MKASVTKDKVSIIEKDIVHAGEYNVNHIEFEFSAEYTADLVKNAVFSIKDNVYQTSIINDQCDIPAEILSDFGEAVFGVYAYKVNDDQLELRYSPFPARFTIISGSYDPTASESEEITPSQFEQYMQALNDGLNKVEESIKKMGEATSSAIQLVDKIEQKLENGDFIGPEGPQGPQGGPGKDGVNGQDGIGITTITSGQSTVEEDKTITPITVNKTDGSSQIFKVEAKNGLDGQNGKDGKDGVNGQNGQDGTTPNIQIGTVETLEPNEHATVTRTGTDEEPVFNFGIPKGQQGEKGLDGANGTDGKDATINGQNTVEITTDNNITLEQQENILKFGLDSQLILKQDVEGTDNTFDDGLESPLYALGGDGKSEQVVTTGANLLPYPYTETSKTVNGITYTVNDDGSILLNGTATADSDFTFYEEKGGQSTSNIPGNYISGGTSDAHVRVISRESSNYHVLADNSVGFTSIDKSTYTKGYVEIKITSGKKFDNVLIKPMLSNEQNIPWEPYTNGIPSPSPDYEQPINSIEGSVEFACRGKNLLKPLLLDNNILNGITSNTLDDGSISLNGTSTSDTYRSIATTNLKANTDYTLSVDSDTTNDIQIFCNVTPTESGTNWIPINNKYTIFRVNNDIQNAIINIFIRNNTTVNKVFKVQLEQGTTATEYEPYVEPNKVTFDLGQEKLRSVGDVKDELVVDLDTGDDYKV